MTSISFKTFLQTRIKKDLPGKPAQLKMQPVPLDNKISFPEPDSSEGHPSSVLIPLFKDHSDSLNVILTLRTDTVRHGGQISFPGGRAENNESPAETALRETYEEVGILPETVNIAGPISPLYLYRSNSRIIPFVGFLDNEPELKPNPEEVQEAFAVPLNKLLETDTLVWETWQLRSFSCRVPYWNIHSTPLWGATAMMMNELLELYKEFLKTN